MVVTNYKVHEGKEDEGSSLHPGLGEISQTEVKGVVEGKKGIAAGYEVELGLNNQ